MAWFRCLIEGENFPLKTDGVRGLIGFFTTRWVKAATPEDAKQKCLELLRDDPSLASERIDGVSPMMFVREIDAMADGPPDAPGGGFTFFPMGS